MLAEQEDVFYYLTVMNENYAQPAIPRASRRGSCAACTCSARAAERELRVQLLGSGTILREVIAGGRAARGGLRGRADIWSVTSFTELRREGLEVERWNRLHPRRGAAQCRRSTSRSPERAGPFVAATDYMRDVRRPDPAVRPRPLRGAGHGRLRPQRLPGQAAGVLRGRPAHVAVAALKALADEGAVERSVVQDAIERYGIDATPRRPGSADASHHERSTGPRGHAVGGARVLNGHWAGGARGATSDGLPRTEGGPSESTHRGPRGRRGGRAVVVAAIATAAPTPRTRSTPAVTSGTAWCASSSTTPPAARTRRTSRGTCRGRRATRRPGPAGARGAAPPARRARPARRAIPAPASPRSRASTASPARRSTERRATSTSAPTRPT